MEIYCVRADFGKYSQDFLDGGYAAIGWIPKQALSSIKNKDELYPLYKKSHPSDTSNVVIGQQVGQISRFLLDIKPGDYVILPASNTEFIYYGTVEKDPYFYNKTPDSCPYPHRKKINWLKEPI